MNVQTHVLVSIFKRNLVSYFSSPTGYVFICVFVLLSSFAAFWPAEFFAANLANLDQLNSYLPYVLLIFIPAITMSVWADERRQGTDELLLTIPATDFDVVAGKYLAAVAIYTVSLVFSLFCNFCVLSFMGQPDLGLFLATYFGYWIVGLAMLAIGIVASFLTNNLTVGFVLGVLFNAPLVFLHNADALLPPTAAVVVKSWSIGEQFRDFGRGVLSLSSLCYFVSIVAVGLYLCMVLIGRRHWAGGADGVSRGPHYLARAVSLLVGAVAIVILAARNDVRADLSVGQLTSLSPETRKLIDEMEPQYPIRIEAYISPSVPESYVQTRLNLLSMLREIESRSRGKVDVSIFDTEPLSEEAVRAEDVYSIESREVVTRSRGALTSENIFLGVAVTSGLQKVVIPFMDRGMPPEYELIRSIVTVSTAKRKKLGVLATDAQLVGGFNPQTMSPIDEQPIIRELRKQYEVVEVRADQPITEKYDILLAVQPSSLGPQQMFNFVAAVRAGQPTAIFEDPFPFLAAGVPGTTQPKQPSQASMFGGMPQMPEEKGDILALWDLLAVDFVGDRVVWQDYFPEKKFAELFAKEFVFIDRGLATTGGSPFNEQEPVSAGLQQLLVLFAGYVDPKNASPPGLRHERLLMTGAQTAYVEVTDLLLPQNPFSRGGGGLNPQRIQVPTRTPYCLAIHVHGSPAAAVQQMQAEGDASGEEGAAASDFAPAGDTAAAEQAAPAGPAEMNVILVTDIDLLYSAFFALREQGDNPDADFNLDVDNVTFVLNSIDFLAGDDRFIEIRKRRREHRTLDRLDALTAGARQEAMDNVQSFQKKFNQERDNAQAEFDKFIADLEARTDIDARQKQIELAYAREVRQAQLQQRFNSLERERDRDINRIERELAEEVRRRQDLFKQLAVLVPPILPLGVAALVFLRRRAGEREGVSRERLR